MQQFKNWTAAYKQLVKRDSQNTSEPGELEELAMAAYLTGRDMESYEVLERAHQGYAQEGKTGNAVRCAFWLAMMFMNAGERARSRGWVARGERLLREAHLRDCPERELLLIPQALEALSAGLGARAQHLFERVTMAGERSGNPEVTVLGRLGLGQAMLQQGEMAGGMKLLDEMMITLETEKVIPLVTGIVYCGAIESCRNAWDLERAQEWTAALARWCDAQPDLMAFRGECLVRKAEILMFRGEWPKALTEITDACRLLSRQYEASAAGEAFYRQAELYRLAGDYAKAENCYREAARRGRNQYPGLALLRLAQGQAEAAETSVLNTLKEARGSKRITELLPALVDILIAENKTGRALEAAKQLCTIARDFNVPYLLALCAHCRGSVLHAKGDFGSSLEHLQKAVNYWDALNLPYEAARSRELRGIVYRALKDKDNSEAEAMAAKWVYEQLGARPDLERINRLLNGEHHPHTHGLSLRELQVLRLVAMGKTNKTVARELFISERTVDRHMSNLFNKLGVSSRVEATAFALKNGMVDSGR